MSAQPRPQPWPQPWPRIAELIPHQPPMRLVDELLDYEDGRARVRAQLEPSNVLADAGRVPATILLELMAQAVAVAVGMREHLAGRKQGIGMLLGTRQLDLTVDDLAIGDVVIIDVQRTFEEAKLARWTCAVTRPDSEQVLARAELNLWAEAPELVSA